MRAGRSLLRSRVLGVAAARSRCSASVRAGMNDFQICQQGAAAFLQRRLASGRTEGHSGNRSSATSASRESAADPTADTKTPPRGAAFWWRRRESNPRPKMICGGVYVTYSVI